MSEPTIDQVELDMKKELMFNRLINCSFSEEEATEIVQKYFL